MCGIAGGFLPDNGPDFAHALQVSLGEMLHRGPDEGGEYWDLPGFLGMRRLSIIDRAGGHQPCFNEDRSISVVFNGEVYNYRELQRELMANGHQFRTRSDTEVIVHLYEEMGDDLCSRLRGMFAFGLWDSRLRRLILGRDRFGKKPLYYAETPNKGIVFASEIKALRPLAEAAGIRLRINPQSVYDYLSLGVVPQPFTIYHGVQALQRASVLIADGNGTNTSVYWRLQFGGEGPSPSYDELIERTRALVSEAVRIRLESEVPSGVFLSSGVDSSIVAYEAARQSGRQIDTFTVAMDEASLDESHQAAETAYALGTRHVVLPLTIEPLEELERVCRQYDQPYADSSSIASMAVAQLARQSVTVVLNGDGGDEVFAGYRRHRAMAAYGRLGRLRGVATAAAKCWPQYDGRPRSALGFASRFARGLAVDRPTRHLVWSTDLLLESDKRDSWRGGQVRSTEEWLESIIAANLSDLKTQISTDMDVILPSDHLVKMDIATMAASVEARSPLMDHVLAEFAARVPDCHLMRHLRLKSLLRDAYRGRLSDGVIRGKKRGFEVPLRAWLKSEFRDIIGDTLLQPTAFVNEYVAPELVRRLCEGRVLQDRNWPGIIYSLLMLELWLRSERQHRPRGDAEDAYKVRSTVDSFENEQ